MREGPTESGRRGEPALAPPHLGQGGYATHRSPGGPSSVRRLWAAGCVASSLAEHRGSSYPNWFWRNGPYATLNGAQSAETGSSLTANGSSAGFEPAQNSRSRARELLDALLGTLTSSCDGKQAALSPPVHAAVAAILCWIHDQHEETAQPLRNSAQRLPEHNNVCHCQPRVHRPMPPVGPPGPVTHGSRH